MPPRRARPSPDSTGSIKAPPGTGTTTSSGLCVPVEALVARRKISRNDEGRYGRAEREPRRRPNQDYFGG